MDMDQRATEMKECDRSPETVLTRLWNKVTPDMRFVFLSTLIMGLITHLFVFTNKFINGDDLYYLYDNIGMHNLSFTAQRGRWCVWLATQITSDNYSMPWVIGFFSLVFISISTCLIVSTMGIRSRLHMFLVGGLMITFATVCCTFAFMYTAAAYFLSLLLSILSVWLTRKYRWGFIPGGILLAFSLGIYQAYICMAIALFAICLLKEILEGEVDSRSLLIHIGQYLACGVIGVLGYCLVLELTMFFMWDTLTECHGGEDPNASSSLMSIGSIISSVKEFTKFFLICGYGITGMISWLFRIATFFVLIMVFVYTIRLCIVKWRRTHALFQTALALGILFTLPIWCNSIRCFVGPPFHYLMIYSYVTLYLLLIVLVEMSCCDQVLRVRYHSIGRWLSFGCIIVVIYVGYMTTNEYYLKLDLIYERAYGFTARVIDRLEQMDELDLEHTPVVLVPTTEEMRPELQGDPSESILDQIRRIYKTSEIKLAEQDGHFSASLHFGYSNMFFNSGYFRPMSEIYFHKKFVASTKKDDEWLESPKVQSMPCFPEKGSIREIDGTIVVKIPSEIVGFGW